jgi:hypothetical protein
MFTIDKIKLHVNSNIIDTIDLCVNLQKIDILKQWEIDCIQEIERRTSISGKIFPLQYELQYLQMVLR